MTVTVQVSLVAPVTIEACKWDESTKLAFTSALPPVQVKCNFAPDWKPVPVIVTGTPLVLVGTGFGLMPLTVGTAAVQVLGPVALCVFESSVDPVLRCARTK